MYKKHKILFIIVPLTVLGVVLFVAMTSIFINDGKIPYNANLSQLTIPDTKIHFARQGECGIFETCSRLDIYEIHSNGTGLNKLYSIDSSQWPSKETGSQFQENNLTNGMGTYDGKAEAGNKKIEINRASMRTTQLVLVNGSDKTILEKRDDFFIGLNIESLQWMPDGRHLLIEEDHKRLGIYDTQTREYAYLTDGILAVPLPEKSSN